MIDCLKKCTSIPTGKLSLLNFLVFQSQNGKSMIFTSAMALAHNMDV